MKSNPKPLKNAPQTTQPQPHNPRPQIINPKQSILNNKLQTNQPQTLNPRPYSLGSVYAEESYRANGGSPEPQTLASQLSPVNSKPGCKCCPRYLREPDLEASIFLERKIFVLERKISKPGLHFFGKRLARKITTQGHVHNQFVKQLSCRFGEQNT